MENDGLWEEDTRQWWNYEGSEQEAIDTEARRKDYAEYSTLYDIEKTIAAQKRGQKKSRPEAFDSYQKGIDEWEKKAVKARQGVAELDSIYNERG